MTLVTSAVAPTISISFSLAFIPMIVSIQLPRAVATKSVGENDLPRPLLSTGASVMMVVPDLRCVASVLRSPLYMTFDVDICTYLLDETDCTTAAHTAFAEYFGSLLFLVSLVILSSLLLVRLVVAEYDLFDQSVSYYIFGVELHVAYAIDICQYIKCSI